MLRIQGGKECTSFPEKSSAMNPTLILGCIKHCYHYVHITNTSCLSGSTPTTHRHIRLIQWLWFINNCKVWNNFKQSWTLKFQIVRENIISDNLLLFEKSITCGTNSQNNDIRWKLKGWFLHIQLFRATLTYPLVYINKRTLWHSASLYYSLF